MHLYTCRTILLFSFLYLLLYPSITSAQNKTTISGIVKDKVTGELMIGASIKIEELPCLLYTSDAADE